MVRHIITFHLSGLADISTKVALKSISEKFTLGFIWRCQRIESFVKTHLRFYRHRFYQSDRNMC